MVDPLVTAVFFDVGETLVDEARAWAEVARRVGVEPHVMWAALGAVIARQEHHRCVYAMLGVEPPAPAAELVYERADLYPDAARCLQRLRDRGYFAGVAGNETAELERWARDQCFPVDVVASSASWGVEKPATAFFERIVHVAGCAPRAVAYVGDRVDNDVLPALEAGLVAVHVRRGPWGYLQPGREHADVRVESLDELPEALAGV